MLSTIQYFFSLSMTAKSVIIARPKIDPQGGCHMHILELTMKNFRGSKDLTLELDPKLNVFVGANGAGKSSVLDATAILLSWLANRIKNPRASGRPIKIPDINNAETVAGLMAHIDLTKDIDLELTDFKCDLSKTRRSQKRVVNLYGMVQLSVLAEYVRELIHAQGEEASIPLLVYYTVNRAVQDISLRIKDRQNFDQVAAYDNALNGVVDFRRFFEWFREREDMENRALRDSKLKVAEPSPVNYQDPQLAAVRSALEKLMPEFRNWQVHSKPLRMEVEKQGKSLTVNQLSDGEKCLMAMVGDLARRLAIANPSSSDPLSGDGIVLIDEIDLHLHPKWQRMVVPRLIQTFPNCQFLITTHSPHVVTHVQPENLHLLEMGEDGLVALQAGESYGKTVERVLEDLMGLETTRPDNVSNDLRAIYRHIADNEFEKAESAAELLRAQIGADPELSKIGVLIRRKHLTGK